MRPLESHVEISSHVWMYNRLRELLIREGMVVQSSDEEDVKAAIGEWLEMVARARKVH
ncbi:MAG: hypothetical protein HQL38_08890 [Alphaproteobacteria bacterium]|nr:hypothetical protein [Alphaproteobacteria bacterium]MBF0392784.1 hypothetical protein [Alphaproteobacteria bacterium]